jgi:Predicted signal transduction protein containing sensor and EAL domains
MDIRERLELFWSGDRPDRIPYTIYHNEWKHFADDPAWTQMFNDGLGVIYHLDIVKEKARNVEYSTTSYTEDGRYVERITAKTPVGTIDCVNVNGWCNKYWLEKPEDYRVMTYIVKNTDMEPAFNEFIQKEKEIQPYGAAICYMARTSFQSLLVDYTGLENLSMHLYDYEDEVLTLYQALLERFHKIVEITAAGPGRYIDVHENFTAETIGPTRFKKFHIPVYEKYLPILKEAGKVVGAHYDGKLLSCSQLIENSPLDLIESLTEPPEGDMYIDECRRILPDKLFWSNINVARYGLPQNELKDIINRMVKQAAPDGKRLAFEVSEHIPVNWRDSMPVVLDILNEIR